MGLADAPGRETRAFYNHPDFVAANADRVREGLAQIPAEARSLVHVVFTAHSIPVAMARTSSYELQLQESGAGWWPARWNGGGQMVPGLPEPERPAARPLARAGYSGPPEVSCARETTSVIIHPIGFLSDHVEVLYDLDIEAGQLCRQLGLSMVRTRTVGTHRAFVRTLRELIAERVSGALIEERRFLGELGPSHDMCPDDCCLPPRRPAARA